MVNNIHLKKAFSLYVKELSEVLPSKEECALISFSSRFEQRMNRILRDHQKLYYPWFNTLGKQVASIALLIILGMAVATFSVKALRERAVELILSFFETFAVIDVQEQTSLPPEAFSFLEPTYLPADFSLTDRQHGNTQQTLTYNNPWDNKIYYSQSVVSSGYNGGINTEDCEIRQLVIHGYDSILSYRPEYQSGSLVFATEYYLFEISGNASPEELIKIAESIPLE